MIKVWVLRGTASDAAACDTVEDVFQFRPCDTSLHAQMRRLAVEVAGKIVETVSGVVLGVSRTLARLAVLM